MKREIQEKDLKASNNQKRCQMILEIIKGQAIYRKPK